MGEIPDWQRARCPECDGRGSHDEPSEESGLEAHYVYGGDDHWRPCDGEDGLDRCDDGQYECALCDGSGDLEASEHLSPNHPQMILRRLRAISRRLERTARLRWEANKTDENLAAFYAVVPHNLRFGRSVMRRLLGACPECPDCEGDGKLACEVCDGKGGEYYSCDDCHESLEDERTVYMGDGFLTCHSCADEKYKAFECATCKGFETIHLASVELDGKTWATVGASCSCCASRPRGPNSKDQNGYHCEESWHSFRARLSDTDRVYYSYLCGDATGRNGCLEYVLGEQDAIEDEQKETLGILDDCAGDDDDGLWNDATSIGGFLST